MHHYNYINLILKLRVFVNRIFVNRILATWQLIYFNPFFVTKFVTVELFNRYFIVFHFCKTFLNLFNISSLYSSRISIFSPFLKLSSGFTLLSSFELVTAFELYFLNIHLLYRLPFLKQFLKNPVLSPVIVFYIFLRMIKIYIF